MKSIHAKLGMILQGMILLYGFSRCQAFASVDLRYGLPWVLAGGAVAALALIFDIIVWRRGGGFTPGRFWGINLGAALGGMILLAIPLGMAIGDLGR